MRTSSSSTPSGQRLQALLDELVVFLGELGLECQDAVAPGHVGVAAEHAMSSTDSYSSVAEQAADVLQRVERASSDVPAQVAPKVPTMISMSAGGAMSDVGLPPSITIEPKIAPKAR